MTDEELQAIKARYINPGPHGDPWIINTMKQDGLALVAEVERSKTIQLELEYKVDKLRSEVERLNTEIDWLNGIVMDERAKINGPAA